MPIHDDLLEDYFYKPHERRAIIHMREMLEKSRFASDKFMHHWRVLKRDLITACDGVGMEREVK